MGRMLRELVVATNNAHKVRELTRLFPGVRLLVPSELGVEFAFEEDGSTYLDNALGKARHLYAQVGRPVLADDSGLEVPALGGEPGICSSRYGSPPGGPKLTDAERCELLLARAERLADRSCFFVCCMALVLDESRFAGGPGGVPGRAGPRAARERRLRLRPDRVHPGARADRGRALRPGQGPPVAPRARRPAACARCCAAVGRR